MGLMQVHGEEVEAGEKPDSSVQAVCGSLRSFEQDL